MRGLSAVLCSALLTTLVLTASAANHRKLQSGGPPPSPLSSGSPSPSPSPTSGGGGSTTTTTTTTTASTAGYTFDKSWPSWLVNPYISPGSQVCADAFVGGFPASYYVSNGDGMPAPFTQKYQNPPNCRDAVKDPRNDVGGVGDRYVLTSVDIDAACNTSCNTVTEMEAYSFDVKDFRHDFKLWTNKSAECMKGTNLMGYASITPACTIETVVGRQVLARFNNLIKPLPDFIMPQIRDIDPCDKPNPYTGQKREGRPISIHHHGSASLAPYDGWASDEICYNETKDYIYPANRPATEWYHDHALDITAANAYWGMAGQFVVRDIDIEKDWGLYGMEEKNWILQDKVFDDKCQFVKDEVKYHTVNLYGDVNMVSGTPWPYDEVFPKWYRFRVLTASISRPFHIALIGYNKATKQVERVSNTVNKACYMIASDAGYRKSPIPFPKNGLFIGVAERYEFVCDFNKIQQAGFDEVYLTNIQDTNRMKEVPFFCLSHLLMKIKISTAYTHNGANPDFDAAVARFNALTNPQTYTTSVENVIAPADLKLVQDRANAGSYDRYFKFERSNGQWVINGETWFTHRVGADDVGTNTYEIWKLEAGGGWFHPIHIHLIDFYVLRRTSGSYPQADDYETYAPKDVVMLFPGAQVYVMARFGAHKGEYMFHCHNLIHEDNAMLRSFNESTYKPQMLMNEAGHWGEKFLTVTTPQYQGDSSDNKTVMGIKTLYDDYWQADLSQRAFAADVDNSKWCDDLDLRGSSRLGITEAFVKSQIMKGYYRLFYPLKNDPTNQYLCDPTYNKWLVPKQNCPKA